MKNANLLVSQKNEVFDLIKTAGLNIFNFEWSNIRSNRSVDEMGNPTTVDRLDYLDSNFYFIFDFLKRQHYCEYSPGKEVSVEMQYPRSWQLQIGQFKNWLGFLQREINQPDMWKDLSTHEVSHINGISEIETSNVQFTFAEVKLIDKGLIEIKNYLEDKFKNQEEKLIIIEESISYVKEAVQRQGRKDWIHTCIGTLFSLASRINISKEQMEIVWITLKNTINGVINFLNP